MRKLYKILVKDMYKIELNGVALIGWIVASLWGVIYLTREVIDAIKHFQ